jgi:hypothetical protein
MQAPSRAPLNATLGIVNSTGASRSYRVWVLGAAIFIVAVAAIYVFMAQRIEDREFECMQHCGSRALKYDYTPPSGSRGTRMDRCECHK